MKIKSESEILDPEIRKTIIQEINQPENRQRKLEALKRYEIYKDLTSKYVLETLEKELESTTVAEMENRVSNLSICKKIINKKARVYKHGAKRVLQTDGDELTESEKDEQGKIDNIYDLLRADAGMKKANRFLELHKNSAVQVLPLKNDDDEWYLKMRILLGHTYDVVEDAEDPEMPLVYILSHFINRIDNSNADIANGGDGRNSPAQVTSFRSGDNTDQLIADAEADQGTNETRYVFWSKSFHFTTNEAGAIIDKDSGEPIENINENEDRIKNEIGRQTIVSLNKDQDGNYWAVGGEDLIDASVLINILLTDLYFIAKVQGMGIFFAIGKGVPKSFKAGPNQGISIDTTDDDGPLPQIGFATSNPPLKDHMAMIEQYLALTLSLNDLAASTMQGKLEASSAPSGIADIIVRSELTSAIEDEQQIFQDAEPEIWKVIRDWQNFLLERGLTVREDFKEIGKFSDDSKIKPLYLPFEEFMTEEQKVKIMQMRQDLGIDTMIDTIMRDNPDLTLPMAEAKLQQLLKEKLENSFNFGKETPDNTDDDDENNTDDENDDDKEDDPEVEEKDGNTDK